MKVYLNINVNDRYGNEGDQKVRSRRGYHDNSDEHL
jgi:hypothetical protein